MMKDYKELAARLRRKANLTEHVHVAREFRAAADAIEELVNANRWTPVTEGLPEESGWYLMTADGESRILWYPLAHGFGWYPELHITAWMALPEPYKEEEK